ncbi:hypothetical protein ACPV5I_12275 [Vibrio gigantis]
MKKSKNGVIFKATLLNQISVLGNIAVGLILLPIINHSFGQDYLTLYIKILATKSIIDIFTSSFGGSFVRLMLDKGIEKGFRLSLFSFIIYGLLASFLLFFYIQFYDQKIIEYSILLSFFVFLSLFQQPFLQKLCASGFQHIPAIVRIVYNLVLFLSILIVSKYYKTGGFELVIKCLVISILISTFLAVLKTIKLNKDSYGIESDVNAIGFFKKSLTGYSAFACSLALCFQIDTFLLADYVSPAVFSAVIVAWKVPNIITQFIWRYCEVNGLESKRNWGGIKVRSDILNCEKIVLISSLVCALCYFIFNSIIYSLWMGEEFSSHITDLTALIFSFGIVSLSLNRVYTSVLQYFDFVSYIAVQYMVIIFVKVIVIYFFSGSYPLSSLCVWFILETIFLFINRSRVFYEIRKI